MEYTTENIEELKTRVINGNQILMDLRSKAFASEKDYSRLMEIYDKKYPLLESLCLMLVSLGYKECLYNDGRNCVNEQGYVCVVCSKIN